MTPSISFCSSSVGCDVREDLDIRRTSKDFASARAVCSTIRLRANHAPVLHDFDISREAGGSVTALVKTFRGIKPNSFDKIVLSFEPSTEFATVNAIAVEEEAK